MFPATSKSSSAATKGEPIDVSKTAAPIDVCHTPTPGGPIPIPYANIIDAAAASGNKAAAKTKVKIIEKQQAYGRSPQSATQAAIMSKGDEAGTLKGIVSGRNLGPAGYTNYSHNVMAEGAGITTRMTSASHNSDHNAPGKIMTPSQTKVILLGE